MSRCAYGSVVFWLFAMVVFRWCYVSAEDRVRNGPGLGGPADWRDWFLDEDARPASSDSGLLVRRITPKSVFVAPSLSGCSEGYRQDGMGRCVKLVKVNQAAQLDFILQKLNAKFAPANNKNGGKDDVGPFHVNIPLSFNKYNATKERPVAQNFSEVDTSSRGDKVIVKTESPVPTTGRIVAGTYGDGTTTKTTPIDSTRSDAETTVDGNGSFDAYDMDVTTESLISLSGGPVEPETTVKRHPDSAYTSGGKPSFVIVVANSTEADVDRHTEEPVSDSVLKTTTADFGAPEGVTSTEAVFFSDPNDADRDVTTTESYGGGSESTVDTTPIIVPTTEVDRRPTPVDTDTEVPSVSPFPVFEPTRTEVSDFFTPSGEDDQYTSSSFTASPDDGQEDTEKTANTNKMVVRVTSSEVENENSDDAELASDDGRFGEKEVYSAFQGDKDIRDQYASSSPPRDATEPSVDCENLPSSLGIEIGHGRIMNPISGNRCKPVEVTSARYPVWTTTPRPPPYYIRFPTDDVDQRPSYPYSTTPDRDGPEKNSFIRFPERPSISSPYRPLPYGSKLWSDGDRISPSASSSGSWYSPPASWIPFFQSQKNWPDRHNPHVHYENSYINRPLPISTMYRKQYHNYRPSSPSNAAPPWIDRRFPWPQRD